MKNRDCLVKAVRSVVIPFEDLRDKCNCIGLTLVECLEKWLSAFKTYGPKELLACANQLLSSIGCNQCKERLILNHWKRTEKGFHSLAFVLK